MTFICKSNKIKYFSVIKVKIKKQYNNILVGVL